jgi:hypothetical protein
MARSDNRHKTIGEPIEEVERIREELFCLQSELERTGSLQNIVPTNEQEGLASGLLAESTTAERRLLVASIERKALGVQQNQRAVDAA